MIKEILVSIPLCILGIRPEDIPDAETRAIFYKIDKAVDYLVYFNVIALIFLIILGEII